MCDKDKFCQGIQPDAKLRLSVEDTDGTSVNLVFTTDSTMQARYRRIRIGGEFQLSPTGKEGQIHAELTTLGRRNLDKMLSSLPDYPVWANAEVTQ